MTYAEIKKRHDDFAAQYSPGPDWEPFNQTHQDRGYLLALNAELDRGILECQTRILALERELAKAKAERDNWMEDARRRAVNTEDAQKDRDEAHAAIRDLETCGWHTIACAVWEDIMHACTCGYQEAREKHAPAIRRAMGQ